MERGDQVTFAGRLPSHPTRLVGRETELEQLKELLLRPEVRLVTLTGLPGIGKTRLAVEVADRLRQHFEDSVAFVDLTDISAPDAVLPHVAHAVGVRRGRDGPLEEHLAAALERRRLLLVLDNCEHLSGAVSHVAEALSACAQMTILATSRERLHLSWEQEFPIPPLRMPDRTRAVDPDGLLRSPAVTLFVERAQSVQPAFRLTAANGEAVSEICIRLGGVPLAIELAAARVKLLTPAQIAARLPQQLQLLAAGTRDFPARHRTMRAAIAWSYDLLTAAEQALQRRLSVFVGGWDLDAAVAIGNGLNLDIFEGMASLVDKSLVTRVDQPDGEARFTMVESVRQFAAECLEAGKETHPARTAHAAHFTGVAERLERQFGTDDEDRAITALGMEQANLRTALEWALDHGDLAPGIRLVAALGWLWYARGDLADGRAQIERVVSAASAVDDTEDLQGMALIPAGVLAWADADYARARLHLTEALRRSQRAGERRRSVLAKAFLGHLARADGDYEQAAALHEECLAEFQALENARGRAWALYDLGLVERDRGAVGEAQRYFNESRTLFQDMDYHWAVAWASWNLGGLAVQRGALIEAASLYAESLLFYQASQDRRGIAQSLEGLAKIAARKGAFGDAVQLLAAADNLRKTLGIRLIDAEQDENTRLLASAEVELGAGERHRLWSAGRGRSVQAAVQAALEVARPVGGKPLSGPGSELTVREREVATLVARGRTNREVGEALGIAEKTAANHVQNIMNKLSVSRRSEIAAWAVARGLHHPLGPPGGTHPTT
ncbi:MAG: ATP-binding protein [bacterium]